MSETHEDGVRGITIANLPLWQAFAEPENLQSREAAGKTANIGATETVRGEGFAGSEMLFAISLATGSVTLLTGGVCGVSVSSS